MSHHSSAHAVPAAEAGSPADAHGRPGSYRLPLRQRDIDVFGHVHYAEYLNLCADARRHWLDDAGIDRPGDHVVARVEIDYLASARLADGWVAVDVCAERIGTASLVLRETVAGLDGREFVRARSVLVRYDPAAARSRPWTAAERSALRGPAG